MLCLRATYLEDQCEWKLEKRKMISPAQRQKEHLVKKYAECRKCLKLIYKAEEEQPLP